MLQPGTEDLELVLQLVPEGQGMLQVGPESVGTLQVLPGGLGGLQHLGPEDQGTQQAGPAPMEPQLVLQLVPEGQGTLQVGPRGLGTLQVLPTGLGTLQVVAGDTGMLQQVEIGDTGLLPLVAGAAEPLLVPEEQGMLPPELRDLEPLPSSPEVQELLRQSLVEGLEPGLGKLETLEVVELMPNMSEAVDRGLEGLGPRLVGECWGWGGGEGDKGVPSALTSPYPTDDASLLDACDPFLPQPEDVALPTINSLFATDFPPLHIDTSDFQ